MKEQVKSHKEDIGTDDDADRCRLWADLAKLGRKCEVWDVAYVAAKFCLIYDDKRWTVEPVKTKVQPSKIGSKSKLQKTSSVSVNRSRSDASARTSSSTVLVNTQTSSTGPAVERETGRKRGRERLYRDLLRTLAETHCIHAECAVYQLKEGGNELGHGISPPPPSKGQQQVGTAESDKTLVAWPGQLSSDAYTSFLRAGELGCSLSETWLVSNVATYLYNYSHHMLQTGSLRPLVPVFRPLLASVVAARGCGANAQAIGADVVCRLSCIVAGGLVQTWMPSPPPDPGSLDPPSKSTAGAGGGRKSGRASGKKKGGGGETHLQVSPDAGPQLQEALEVCERGLGAGGELTLATRATLLAVWVQCKQLLQQPISSKTLGVEKEAGDSDTAQCRAVVAVEMLSLMGNRIWDFPDCPSLNEAFELVCACQWSDVMLELELLTRIARLALLQGNHSLVNECSSRALQSVQGDKEGGKRRRRDESAVQRERELLSCVCSLQGQALVAMPVGGGKVASSRAAMDAFRQSAKYGRAASSYHRALEASQHYWNTCRELISSPLDREAVQQPLRELLTILTSFLPKRTHGSVEQKQEDLALHVAMYNIVFQVYIDKGEWEEGLKAIEEAMSVTPRTIHRDLAEHKLVFRSKMGRNVDSDMVRFQVCIHTGIIYH
jgi:tetratricopeptide (TPR) repeat protein